MSSEVLNIILENEDNRFVDCQGIFSAGTDYLFRFKKLYGCCHTVDVTLNGTSYTDCITGCGCEPEEVECIEFLLDAGCGKELNLKPEPYRLEIFLSTDISTPLRIVNSVFVHQKIHI